MATEPSLPTWMRLNDCFNKDLSDNNNPMNLVSPAAANLVSSRLYLDEGVEYHLPVIDLDMNAALLPSSTTGHHHLMIDKPMPKEDYDKLLRVLNEVGLLQDGIIKHQWEKDGVTCIRMPGIQKESKDVSSGSYNFKTGKVISNVDAPTENGIISHNEMKKQMTDAWAKVKKYSPESDTFKVAPGPTPVQSVNTLKNDSFVFGTEWGWNTPVYKIEDDVEEAIPVKGSPTESEPDLFDVAQAFKQLGEVAKTTGESLESVVKAWRAFIAPVEAAPKPKSQNQPDDSTSNW